MDRRKSIVTKIHIYKKRRLAMTKKISQWQNELRRIDNRADKLDKIIQRVNRYFSVDVKSKCLNTNHKLARSVFYKYTMENGFEGAFVSRTIGRYKKAAASGRLRFTRSFKWHPENKQAYKNFLFYINQSIPEIKQRA